jgi:hypothetical protein
MGNGWEKCESHLSKCGLVFVKVGNINYDVEDFEWKRMEMMDIFKTFFLIFCIFIKLSVQFSLKIG